MTDFLRIGRTGNNRTGNYLLTSAIVMGTYIVISVLPFWLDAAITGRFQLEDLANLSKLSSIIGKNLLLAYLLLPFLATSLALLFCIRFIHNRPIRTVFTGREAFDWQRFWFSFFSWGVSLTSFILVSFFFGATLKWNFHLYDFSILVMVSIVLVPIQTTCEELFFRGFLFQWLGQSKVQGWFVILFTGIFFGLMHYNNPEIEVLGPFVILYYIFTGIFLSTLVRMDDGLELSMGYHAVNNLFAALILTNSWQAFQTDALFLDPSPPSFGWDNYVTLLIVQPFMLYLFSKKYKWTNYREKLFRNQD
jgi:membrane protease YdiL (CAAX protease family)